MFNWFTLFGTEISSIATFAIFLYKKIKDKRYKVTSIIEVLKYFKMEDMWDINAIYRLRDEDIKYMKDDC